MITEVNLSAFVYRLFHGDFPPIVGTNIQSCDSRTKFNYMFMSLCFWIKRGFNCFNYVTVTLQITPVGNLDNVVIVS